MVGPGVRVVGRYAMYGEIAAGGMATVHVGRLLGPVGFSRTVAIKRLHAQYAKDPDFVSMFLDEARVAARIQHPNVVPTLDVVALEGELFLVMEYVAGESLSKLLRALRGSGQRMPPRVAGAVMTNVLYGLHAAHEARSERGEPLGIVHRDVSPQNVLVGLDGVARMLDFGVAKASGRVQMTGEGQVKGKLAYMPVEQIAGNELDRRADVYAASVVLWEALTGERLFDGPNDVAIMHRVLSDPVPPPSRLAPDLPPGVDEIVLRGAARRPCDRFQSAYEMAVALEERLGVETPRQVGALVGAVAREILDRRALLVKEIESFSGDIPILTSPSSTVSQAPIASGPGDSSVSSISTSASHAPGAPRRSLVLPIAAAVSTLGLGAGALALVLALRDGGHPAAARPPAEPAVTVAEAPAEEIASPPATAIPPAGAASSTHRGDTSTVAAPSSQGTAAASATAPRPTVPAPQRPPPAQCNPPYVVVSGIRKLKPECL